MPSQVGAVSVYERSGSGAVVVKSLTTSAAVATASNSGSAQLFEENLGLGLSCYGRRWDGQLCASTDDHRPIGLV